MILIIGIKLNQPNTVNMEEYIQAEIFEVSKDNDSSTDGIFITGGWAEIEIYNNTVLAKE